MIQKKHIIRNIGYVIIGIVCAVGLSYVHAATFTNGSNPPANNTPLPLNAGSNNQSKAGGISVGTFIANANAELDGTTYFNGVLHADPANSNSTINFGGTDPNNFIHNVSLAISGAFSNTGTIGSTTLANNSLTPVCSDTNGNVILCNVTSICSNIPNATTIPPGDARNSDGTCTIALKHFYSATSSGPKSAAYFTQNVANGHTTYTYQQKNYPNINPGYPWLGTLGIDNDTPYGWTVDDIGGVQGTGYGFGNSNSQLLQVQEKGSYDVKISSQGRIGVKGKFSGDNNQLAVAFYMVLNQGQSSQQWISLSTASAGSNRYAEPYPMSFQPQLNFYVNDASSSSGGSGYNQNKGDQYSYAPYNFTFHKVMALNPGDTINIYSIFYGRSDDDSTLSLGNPNSMFNSSNNFFYYIDATQNIFDITETPG